MLAQATQLISATRTFIPAWNASGYDGTFPNRTGVNVKTAFSAVGDGVTNDTAAIQNALAYVNTSPDVKMVYFPAGTYLITSAIELPANVTIRGEVDANGNNLAKLKFNHNNAWADSLTFHGSAGPTQAMSAANMHDTQITVTDGSVFAVGDFAEVWQDDDPSWDYADSNSWAVHCERQVVKITAVSGNVLTLEQELRANYVAGRYPEIRKITPKTGVGILNLNIERADPADPAGGSLIHCEFAANCLIQGVDSYKCDQRHVELYDSTKITITGCYFHEAYGYGGGGSGYGVEPSCGSGEVRVENNIFRKLRHAMLMQWGSNGNVFGYNYSREATRTELFSTLAADIASHGNRPYANLMEGNIVCYIWFDGSHGQSHGPYQTVFRNATTVQGFTVTSTSPASTGLNLVGNDLYAGSYSPSGSDRYEYGNRLRGATAWRPSTITSLPDKSYYLGLDPQGTIANPSWWTLAANVPTIGGFANLAWNAYNNPAKARWDGGGCKTVPFDAPLNLI